MMSFKDKVTVVTGGSRGFGKALAAAFVREGAQVIITGIDSREGKAAAAEIGAVYAPADARSFEQTEKLAQEVKERFKRIDVWVNNAGIQIAPADTELVPIEKLHNVFAVNFFGYFYGCKVALAHMKQQGDGTIVTINSTAGLSGKPGLAAYAASKFAVKGLSETIREEIKGTPIKLYQIFPGGMQTDIYHEQVPADFDSYMPVAYAIEKVMANFKAANPEADLIIRRPTSVQ